MRKGTVVCVLLTVLMVLPATFVSALPMMTSETEIRSNTISITYVTSSPVTIDPTTPDYEAETDSVTYNGITYAAVNIVNADNENDAVADADGNVNVTLDLNDARPFCFEIHHINGENSKLRFIVTINGSTTQYTSNISGNVYHYIGATGKYFGMVAMRNSDDWIQSDTPVNIQIYNYNGHVPDNVTLKIVFKP